MSTQTREIILNRYEYLSEDKFLKVDLNINDDIIYGIKHHLRMIREEREKISNEANKIVQFIDKNKDAIEHIKEFNTNFKDYMFRFDCLEAMMNEVITNKGD